MPLHVDRLKSPPSAKIFCPHRFLGVSFGVRLRNEEMRGRPEKGGATVERLRAYVCFSVGVFGKS